MGHGQHAASMVELTPDTPLLLGLSYAILYQLAPCVTSTRTRTITHMMTKSGGKLGLSSVCFVSTLSVYRSVCHRRGYEEAE